MKIALVCEHGGHLTEMLFLLEAFTGHEIFFITNQSPRTRALKFKKKLIHPIGSNPLSLLKTFFIMLGILRQEKPDIIISTGAEIAIPAFFAAKLLGIKTIYIESWCRVKTPSRSGKILYHFSNLFLVQWPQLVNMYGMKAKYVGGIV